MFSPGDLVILAGRPSMGKSGFAKAIARNIAISGVAVGIFSLEDSSGAFYRRLLADEAEIRASKLRDPRLLNSEDWSKVVERQEKIKDLPIWIDDRPKASLRSIIAKAESVKAEHDIKLFIIDYLGLVKSDKRKENRNAEVTHICGELKDLAKFLEIPVLVLSQLNRECESRTNKRPMLSDLRESGSIEQDADTVLFIYRDSFYHQDADKTEVEIIVAKQRNGPIGRVLLKYYEEYQQFRDKEDIPIF
jgi:replicative DNA helicase